MEKPCNDCGKKISIVPIVKKVNRLNLNLDIAEGALQAAWATDVSEDQREKLSELILQVQKFKRPHVMPLNHKLWALRRMSWQIGKEINCKYCQNHFYHDVVESIDWALAAEQKQYLRAWELFKHKEVHKTYWLFQAIWHKLILNKLDLWRERIKWYTSKLHLISHAQNVKKIQ